MKKSLLIAAGVVSGIAATLYFIKRSKRSIKSEPVTTIKKASHHLTDVFAKAKHPTISNPN